MSMTKQERQELGQLIRKREKVMKSQAEERSAALMAEFDAHSAKIYHWDDDATWAAVKADADAHMATATESLAARCRELGIPAEFAPQIGLYWNGRGHGAVEARRRELRQVARSRIVAMEKEACAKIERISLEAQTKIISEGLTSDGAKQFLDQLQSVESLMPPIALGEIEALVDTRTKERERLYLN